jgi:LuxR family transcriptional regulator, regulator of acetate metabolism
LSSPVRSCSAAPLALLGVGHALRHLRAATSLPSLFGHATYALCQSVGFERAALFRLHGRTLAPESVYLRGSPEESEAACKELRSGPRRLGAWLHESEALRRRMALLVEDAPGDPRALDTLAGAASYVAAPVICQDRAVGLLHADRGVEGPAVTELDRDALSAFAEGFGYALERALVADRLRTQSERVLSLLRSTEASVTELGGPGVGLSGFAQETLAPPETANPDSEVRSALTPRELEVLGMLAQGETNAGIASRLVVTEDTVKTHVKHILRKLGVQNRSQAVSRYFLRRAAEEEPSHLASIHRIR